MTPPPTTRNAAKRKSVLRISVLGWLIFFKKFAIHKNIVPPIKAIPGKPNTNEIPGLGKAPAVIRANIVNVIATYVGIRISLLKNGRAIRNNEIGILKY